MLPPGSRTSKIRPPRRAAAAEAFEPAWSVLADAISLIQHKNVSQLSYEQLYRKAYSLVLHKHGSRLYENVARAVEQHLALTRAQLLQLSREDLVPAAVTAWHEHLQAMKFISDILMYLNRVYVKDHNKLLVYDMGVALFKDTVIKAPADSEAGANKISGAAGGDDISDDSVGNRMVAILLDDITAARNGGAASAHLLQVIAMFEMLYEENDVNYYQKVFEPRYLERSRQFLQNCNFSLDDTLHILKQMSQFLQDETTRATLYLPAQTLPKFLDLMNNIIVRDQLERIILLPDGLGHRVTAVDYDYLRLVYDLNCRIDPQVLLLKKHLCQHIVAHGMGIKDALGAEKLAVFATGWVEAILKFKRDLLDITRRAFYSDFSIDQVEVPAIVEFVNNKAVNAAECLLVYMDQKIKQQIKSRDLALGDTTQFIDQSMQFLQFISDKDTFEAYYKNHFARRFLTSKTLANSDIDVEEMVIKRLIEEMGAASLESLIKMNRDIDISRQLTSEFKTRADFALDLKICNVVYWPSSLTKDYTATTNIWPRQFKKVMAQFGQHWEEKNSNKTLYWLAKYGSVNLRISYPLRTYDINMLVYCGIIMMLFASDPFALSLLYGQIKELTAIPESDLKRSLQSIAVASRSRLLTKRPMSKDINEDDVFSLNGKFKSQTAKVKVLTVSSAKPKDNVEAAVQDHRNNEVNAAIVRILKARKTIVHADLVNEVVRQLQNRFLPLNLLIKRQIEELIEKEYIRREDRTVYHYIA